MPYFYKEKTKHFDLYIWEISNNEDFSDVILSSKGKEKLAQLKKEINKKQFLSTRNILQKLNIFDKDIFYNEKGKPFLEDKNLSISHSKNYSAVVISNNKIGIDIECSFEKIIKIKEKFLSEKEIIKDKKDIIFSWSKKESLYKFLDNPTGNFKKLDILDEKYNFYTKEFTELVLSICY